MSKPNLYDSSIAQKFIVGLTGLFLCSFLVVHLTGNLLLFKDDGGAAFDAYSHFMSTNGVIRTLEVVLFAGFLAHVAYATRVWLKNRKARPTRYVMNRPMENSSLASRSMHWTGAVVFIFLVIHLRTFFVPSRFSGGNTLSMFELVQSAFSSPLYDAFYLVSLALLGYHLRHGFQSAFQSLGLRPFARAVIEIVAVIFWLIIPIGFATMPVYFLWRHLTGVS